MPKPRKGLRPGQADCPLLELPPAILTRITKYLFQDIKCHGSFEVWNKIQYDSGFSKANNKSNKIAILLACWQLYNASFPILYNNAAIELYLRAETKGLTSLGTIEKCPIINHLRHIRLTVCFNAKSIPAMDRVNKRAGQLIEALNEKAKLQTVELIFINERPCRHQSYQDGCDQLLEQFATLECKRLLGISHNVDFWDCYGTGYWTTLEENVEGWKEGDESRTVSHEDYGDGFWTYGKQPPGCSEEVPFDWSGGGSDSEDGSEGGWDVEIEYGSSRRNPDRHSGFTFW